MTSERQTKNELYCLTCHREIEHSRSRLHHCDSCGSSHHAVDYERYWSRSPRLELLTSRVSWLASLLVVTAIPTSYFLSGAGLGDLSMVPMILMLFAGLAAFSAGRLMKKVTVPSSVFWVIALLILGSIVLDQAERFQDSEWGGLFYPSVLAIGLGLLLSLLALALGPRWRAHELRQEVDLQDLKAVIEKRVALLRSKRHYCLACFESMPEHAGVCDSCGFHNFSADRRVYWNRNPRIQALETLGVVLAAIFGVILAGLSLFAFHHAGMGSGWFVAMSAVVSYALGLTCAKMTRHMVSFQPSLFWCLVVVLLGATIFPNYLFRDHSFGFQLVATFSCFALAAVPLLLGQVFARWKRSLQEGTEEASQPLGAS